MKALIASILMIATANGVTLSDEQEARAQALMREIRCVACENEPISQSASDIATNMRTRVRTMISEGASDAQVREWFAGRYGEFVLFRPDVKGPADWLLWGGPFVLLAIGAAGAFLIARRPTAQGDPVSPVAPEDLHGE